MAPTFDQTTEERNARVLRANGAAPEHDNCNGAIEDHQSFVDFVVQTERAVFIAEVDEHAHGDNNYIDDAASLISVLMQHQNDAPKE